MPISGVVPARGEFVRDEVSIIARDGQERVMDFSLKPVRGEDGRVELLIPEGRDITELKRAQEHLASALAEVEELRSRLEEENVYLREQVLGDPSRFPDLVGESLALRQVQTGATVERAVLASGFESEAGFREAFAQVFGNPPSAVDRESSIWVNRVATPLGSMIVGVHDGGLCLLEFAERRMLDTQLKRLSRHMGRVFLPGEHPLMEQVKNELDAYFDGTLRRFSLPLTAPGTAFQEAVWSALLEIPFGETRSYADIAASIGDRGTQVLVEYDLNNEATELFSVFDANPPTALWSDGSALGTEARMVASADAVDTHVAIHQVVVGGPLFHHGVDREFSDIDFRVLGEAEITLPRFLDDLGNGCARQRSPRWLRARITGNRSTGCIPAKMMSIG